MALIIKKTAPVHTPVPACLHHATCIRLIDLGTQRDNYQGKAKQQHKIMLIWELVGVNRDDGTPHIVAKKYTASLSPKAKLAADLQGWLGTIETEEFDLTQVLGKSCAVNITHRISKKDNATVYADVQSVSPPMAGFPIPEPQSTPKAFDLSAPDWDLFAEFSDWTQTQIRQSPEYAALDLPENAPPPLKAAEPQKQKMPLNEQIIGLLSDSLKAGATTLSFIAENYEMTEEQRLHFESLTA